MEGNKFFYANKKSWIVFWLNYEIYKLKHKQYLSIGISILVDEILDMYVSADFNKDIAFYFIFF